MNNSHPHILLKSQATFIILVVLLILRVNLPTIRLANVVPIGQMIFLNIITYQLRSRKIKLLDNVVGFCLKQTDLVMLRRKKERKIIILKFVY